MLENLTIALDVDGVLSPITEAGSGTPENAFPDFEYRILSSKNFGAAVAEEVIATIQTLINDGVNVQWHTSWREMANECLAPELGFAPLDSFTDDETFRNKQGWWKLEAVKKWIADTEGTSKRLLWIDDDIADAVYSGEVTPDVLHHPRVSIVSPRAYWGLSPHDLEVIAHAAYSGERIAFANDPSDPRPLPSTPGSIIAWGELEDPDTGERWAAVATAIETPDGGILWADAFIEDANPSSIFTPEHLNSVEWVHVLDTVKADDAPENVKAAFNDGDVILGAVFDSKLEGIDVTFTTAAGVFYSGELSEVFAVDVYGNLYEGDADRKANYLPTELV